MLRNIVMRGRSDDRENEGKRPRESHITGFSMSVGGEQINRKRGKT